METAKYRFSSRSKAIRICVQCNTIHILDAVVKDINATGTELWGGNLWLQ